MTKFIIEPLSDEELAQATTAFGERQAARELATRHANDIASSRSKTIIVVREAMTGARDARSVLTEIGSPVPFAVLSVVKMLFARDSAAVSLQARAANTTDTLRRNAGDCQLSLIEDDDVTFIVVDLEGPMIANPPTHLSILGADGTAREIELPGPVEASIQWGIAKTDPDHSAFITLLSDPQTALFFS